jgi:cytochrome b561
MKYPLPMRLLHWIMAAVILGMVWAGWTMVSMDDHVPAKFDVFYPWHKSFGMLVLILVSTRLVLRARASIPKLPEGLPPWNARMARTANVLLYVLMIAVPCMGYSLSSSYTQSDGVFFFGVNLPELLPKNDARYEVFRVLHRWLAYTLLGVVIIHAAGALKHRFLDRNRANDVLSRML